MMTDLYGGAPPRAMGMPPQPVAAVTCQPPDEAVYRQLWPFFGRPVRIVLWVLLGLCGGNAAITAVLPPTQFFSRQQQLLETLFYLICTAIASAALIVCYVHTMKSLSRAARRDIAAYGGEQLTYCFYFDHVELRAGQTRLVGFYADMVRAAETADAIVMIFRDGQVMLLRGEDMTPWQGQAVRQCLLYLLGSRYRVRKPLACTAQQPAVPQLPTRPPRIVTSACTAPSSGALKNGLSAAFLVLLIFAAQAAYTVQMISVSYLPGQQTAFAALWTILVYSVYAVVFAILGGIGTACALIAKESERKKRRLRLLGISDIRFDVTDTHLLVSDEHGTAAYLLCDVKLRRRGKHFIVRCGAKKWRISRKRMTDPAAFWQHINIPVNP
ncbi:MAG: hypothetical protein ACI39E_01075 [Acutalibacteraceae bacterium]